MIKIDISRAISLRWGIYVLGVIPGIFFEASLALAEPCFANLAIDRVKQLYPFGSYAVLLIFLASCLVIGQVFFILSWFVGSFINHLYRSGRWMLGATIGSEWLYRFCAKHQPSPPRPNSIYQRILRVNVKTKQRLIAFGNLRTIMHCWRLVAVQLLKERYGLDRSDERWDSPERELEAWQVVLGKPISEFQHAWYAMRTVLSCGIAGFAAMYIATALRDRYFIAMCTVFVLSGCITLWSIALAQFQPVAASMTRLKSVLLDLAEARRENQRPLKSNSGKLLGIDLGLDKKDDDEEP